MVRIVNDDSTVSAVDLCEAALARVLRPSA